MESERDQVSRADIYSILVRFAYYLVSTVSQAFNYGTITAIVATKLGPDGLTAYAISTTILLYISYMFLFPVSGRLAAIAEAVAIQDNQLTGKRILFTLSTAIVVGLLVGLVLWLVEEPFVGFFTSDVGVQDIIYPFYSIHCAIIPLNMLTVVVVGIFELWGKTYWMLFFFVFRNGLDALLNYIVIDVLQYTVLLASAVATLTAAGATTLLGLFIILRPRNWELYFLERSCGSVLDVSNLVGFKSDNFFLAGKSFLAISLAVSSAIFADKLDQLPAHFVSFLFFWWGCDVSEALGMVNSVVGSTYVFERRYRAKMQLDMWMTVAGLILGSCLTLVYYLAQKELIQIYALDNAMADTIAIVWQCLTFVQLISGVNGVLEGAIAGNGRFNHLFYVNILAVTTFLTIGVINNYVNRTLEFLWWGLLIFQGAKLFPYIVLVHWYLKNELHLKEKALLPSALNYDYGSNDYVVITREQQEEIDREHYASSPRSERI